MLRYARHCITFIIILFLTATASAKSYTEEYFWARNPFLRDRNPRKPKTIMGVMNAYRTFVIRKNGIDQDEAKIIAQYRLIKEDHYLSFDFRKPKIVEEREESWSVRFPGKYSITYQKVNNFIYIVSKLDGSIFSAEIVD